MTKTWLNLSIVVGLALMLAVSGCSEGSLPLESRVVFFDKTLKEELPEFKPDQMTLWFPLISGHLAGSPNQEFVSLQVGPEYRFKIDLKEKADSHLSVIQRII